MTDIDKALSRARSLVSDVPGYSDDLDVLARALLQVAAERDAMRGVVETAVEWSKAESNEAHGLDQSRAAVESRQLVWRTLDALRAALATYRASKESR